MTDVDSVRFDGEPTHVKLMAWWLHDRGLFSLFGQDVARAIVAQVRSPELPFGKAYNQALFAEAMAQYLVDHDVQSAATQIVAGQLSVGSIVWLDQDFYFKNVTAAYMAGRTDGATLWCNLDVDRSVKLTGTFNPQRITTDSSLASLKGRQQMFVVARVATIDGSDIAIQPLFIGDRLLERGQLELSCRDSLQVFPEQIDQFGDVNFALRLSKSHLDVLRAVPEVRIKASFAEIIGEPEVPKDWGGEQFDLFTDRMTVKGERLQAAIMFKGPAAFRPMTIADLGKNGDQISRLSQTAADLLVVQHCHAITPEVLNMLRTYALTPGNYRRYMTIDGYNTIRILRHFGYLDPGRSA